MACGLTQYEAVAIGKGGERLNGKVRQGLARLAVLLLVGLPLPALAVPALQLRMAPPFGTSETTTETWTADQATFSLWPIDTQPTEYDLIDDGTFSIPLPQNEPDAPAVRVTNNGSVPFALTASGFSSGTLAGLSPHGLFPTLFSASLARDLLVASAGDTERGHVLRPSSTDLGNIEILTEENLGFSGLHFDLTGNGMSGNHAMFLFSAGDRASSRPGGGGGPRGGEGPPPGGGGPPPGGGGPPPGPPGPPGPPPGPPPPAPIPEPGTLLLLGSGLAGLAAGGWRKRRRAMAKSRHDAASNVADGTVGR
ncbi:MAG: choice-of-anchor N protein [candidate division NC10 bacterium]|nr:choice-of-anchor N protein [candidate division NC10 bacterium]